VNGGLVQSVVYINDKMIKLLSIEEVNADYNKILIIREFAMSFKTSLDN